MATDFAYAAMLIPVLVGILALIAIALLGSKNPIGVGFVGLGRRRIALGYLGALAGALLYTCIDSIQLLLWKADQGHISSAEVPGRIPGAILYFFVVFAPFVVAILSFVGLPMLSVLRRFGWASVTGAVICALLFSSFWAGMVVALPFNQWCGAHLWLCGGQTFLDSLGFSAPIALGFALFAGLPWVRSPSPA